jgi:hypothetical protein
MTSIAFHFATAAQSAAVVLLAQHNTYTVHYDRRIRVLPHIINLVALQTMLCDCQKLAHDTQKHPAQHSLHFMIDAKELMKPNG